MGSEETSDCLSLARLRALAIPTDDVDQWDHGELPHAVLNLENQTALSECSLLLQLSVVERRSLDETKESRAFALREILVDLLPKELDHPYCSALRALAGLEPGTAGRNRERRQQVAGVALGTERHPATTRTVRRRVKEDCWPWLLDRLIEREVNERRSARVGDSPAACRTLPLELGASATPAARDETPALRESSFGAPGAVAAGEPESLIDVARRMGWLANVNTEDSVLDLVHGAIEDVVARYGAEGPLRLVPEVVRLRSHVQRLLEGHQHPQQRRRLYELAGRLSGMLGYMAVNQARFLLSEAYCAEAFALAAAAEDLDLQAWVRGTESLCAYYQKHYTDALDLARDGQRYARGGAQAIRLAINGEARALGRLGDHRGVDEAVDRAYVRVTQLPPRVGLSPCISFDPYSEARVAANAATAYLSLGATGKVLDYAARIESPVEESHSDWDRSLVHLDVATALIRQERPDVEHAADIGIAALQASAANPIASIRQRAGEFTVEGRRWHTRPAIREFIEALRCWNATTLPGDTGKLETT
jgi:hypothetical protein